MIEFRLDPGSGVSTHRQLVDQVKNALRLGMLREGDQLPTVREVVAALVINPNTVHKAYRDLEFEGLVRGRPGQGTFVERSLGSPAAGDHRRLQHRLARWISDARAAGFDDNGVRALFATALRDVGKEEEEDIA